MGGSDKPELTAEEKAGRVERRQRVASEQMERERHRRRMNARSVLISRSERGSTMQAKPAVLGVAA